MAEELITDVEEGTDWTPPEVKKQSAPSQAWTPPEVSKKKESTILATEPSSGESTIPSKPLVQKGEAYVTPSRGRLLDVAKKKATEILSTPFYQDEKNRDAFFNRISSRYSPEEIKYLQSPEEGSVEPQNATHPINEQSHKNFGGLIDITGKPEPTPKLDKAIDTGENILAAAGNAMQHGLVEGYKQLKNTGNIYDREGEISATGNAAAGIAKMVFGALNVVPAIAAFSTGAVAATEVAPNVAPKLLAPISTLTHPETEGGKAWAELGDFVLFGIATGGLMKGKSIMEAPGKIGAEGIVEGLKEFAKEPPEKQQQIINDYAKQKAKDITPTVPLTPAEQKLKEVNDKRTALQQDHANAPDEAKPILENKLQESEKELDATNDVVTQEHLTDAHDAALEEKKTRLKELISGMKTDEGKKALEDEINVISSEQSKDVSTSEPTGQPTSETKVVPEEPTPAEPVSSTELPKKIEGWHTPVTKGKESVSKIQSSGLPKGKFFALDKPFGSDVHDIGKAKKETIDLKGKRIYNPSGDKGFEPTENVHKEMADYLNSKKLKDVEQGMTDFLKSKGYDGYVRLIDGQEGNRELIMFDYKSNKVEPLKPKQDAIPEPSTETLHVRETSGNRKEMEQGVSKPEESTGVQKQPGKPRSKSSDDATHEEVTTASQQGIKPGDIVFTSHQGRSKRATVFEVKGDKVVAKYNHAGKEITKEIPLDETTLLETKEEASKKVEPPTFDEKVDEVATKIKKALKPKTPLPEGTQKMGLGVDELVDGAAKIIKESRRKGIELKEAIDKAIDYIKAHWDNAFGTFDEAATRKLFEDDKQFSDKYYTKHEDIATAEDVKKILDSLPKENKTIGEKISEAIKESKVAKIARSLYQTFHPFLGDKQQGEIYNPARKTAIELRKALGEKQHINEIAAQGTEQRTLFWDKQPLENKVWFIANLEKGTQFTGELKALADSYKKRLDDVYKIITSIKDIPYIEDYFPHFWKDPKKAQKFFSDELSKRPLHGSKSFTKARFYQDIIAGMKAGLELKTDNPEEIVRIAEINASKFKMANDFFDALKEQGLVDYYKTGDQPEGWKLVDDPLFKRTSLFKTAEGTPAMKTGGYYMPEEAARIIESYTSRGIHGDAADIIRNYNNLLNQFQLGLSFFHGMTTSIDATVTGNAIAMNEIAQGKPIKGAFDFLKSATIIPNLIETLYKGNKAIKDYRSGVINPIVEKMISANARVGQDAIYKNDMAFQFDRAMAKGNFLKQELLGFPAMIETFAKPIFEYYVPRLKVGGFVRVLENELGKLDNPTEEQINHTAQKVWDEMDNRLGQMTYDNLFWNKTVKDAGFLGLRSLGWNLGTARAIGGGLIDVPASAKSLVQGKGGSMRTMWLTGLITQAAVMGAMYQKLMTGENPKTWKDYFYPWDGSYNPDGTRHRVTLPTYMKDLFAVKYHGILSTLGHKVSPAANEAVELMNNKDFYGGQIYNEDDKAYQKAKDIGAYLLNQISPFTFRTRPDEKLSMFEQFTTAKGLERKFGIMPAMRDVEREPWQNLIVAESGKNADEKAKTKVQQEAASAKRELHEVIFNDPLTKEYTDATDDDAKEQIRTALEEKYNPLIQELRDKGYWSDSNKEFLKQGISNPYSRMFSYLTPEQQLKVISQSPDDVKEQLKPEMHSKAVFDKLLKQKPELLKDHPEYEEYFEVAPEEEESAPIDQ